MRVGWRVVGATVAGRSHRLRGDENQDSFLVASRRDGALLCAVADGAGSAARAAEGASLSTRAALGSLAESQGSDRDAVSEALREALEEARRAVAKHASSQRLAPRSFASTLLLALVTGHTLGVLQLGDGAVVARDEHGAWQRLLSPGRGSFAGETIFVTSRGATRRAEQRCLDSRRLTALALLTDGLEPLAIDLATDVPHAPFFEPLYAFVGKDGAAHGKCAELEAFLASDRLQSRSADDLTLVLALPEAG